ncbi:MAG TPA: asparagine synthase (glutamine-hydrolyzing) [Candidatus Binatia bacterium]|jgi:asparagine synthase (glutamine-hydrolysing)|nr:asparagine synthase (glutamine-hydrolyzing) [Candidatus Binatia bacterium]
MCGIAGLLTLKGDAGAQLQQMNTLLRHRGPDDEGYLLAQPGRPVCLGGGETPPEVFRADMPYRPIGRLDELPGRLEARLGLAHRRLSILDLSPLGHQPMSYQDRYWMVYNGEVYNYLELRSELETLGRQFLSHCDTEVILAAYAEWGLECFPRFNGMWALAIYDTHTNELVLSRDRFGIKPLYYWATDDLFAFASEIKAFTCLPGWHPRLNGQAAYDFLLAGLQDHSRETMFARVFQVEPGCYARLNTRSARTGTAPVPDLHVTRWYQLEPQLFNGSFADAATRFGELLIDSVRLRLRSDVTVGSCLSGGLDSSSIVSVTHLLLRQTKARLAHKTFSACSEIKCYDERDYIEKVVAATGVESHYVFPSLKDFLALLDQVIWHQDEPFTSTSIYAQWCVFQLAAARKIKVMLDGQGADEQLYGYPNFHRAFLGGMLRQGRILCAWREALAARRQWNGALSAFGRALVDGAMPMAWQRRFRQLRRNQRSPAWLAPEALGASFPGPLAARFNRHTSARELSLELLTGAHLQMLLHWEDRNSMAHSIEARVPFLDYRLVEFVTGLPDRYKIRSGLTKAVLREGMSGLVPAEVLARRDKIGFVTPEEMWAQESAAELEQRLAHAVDASRGVLKPQATTEFAKVRAGRAKYDPAVWRMLIFGGWLRRFNVAV